jgi:hypothetical protein
VQQLVNKDFDTLRMCGKRQLKIIYIIIIIIGKGKVTPKRAYVALRVR